MTDPETWRTMSELSFALALWTVAAGWAAFGFFEIWRHHKRVVRHVRQRDRSRI